MALFGQVFRCTNPRGTVVMLHGLGEDHSVWAEMARRLVSAWECDVLCPDLPGAGQSRNYQADALSSIDFFAREVVTWVEAHSRIKPTAWVGHSMGGYVALAAAKMNIPLIHGIFLFHSTPEPDSAERRAKREQAIRVYSQNPELFLREFYRNLFAQPETEENQVLIQQLLYYGLTINAEHFVATLRALRDRPDYLPVFKNHVPPKAILAGKYDNVLNYERLSALATECQAIFFPAEKSGHMAMYEEKETTYLALSTFVSEYLKNIKNGEKIS
ncbi:MAG: alpha/beta hydrolase [Flavobacteriales bacterium]|nr:alpha/beta hydrolase [Flavobacteriales bacterium]